MSTVVFECSKPSGLTVKYAFQVTMKSGRLTRQRWVRNRVQPKQIVRDTDGRLFRVHTVKMTPSPAVQLVSLKIVGG